MDFSWIKLNIQFISFSFPFLTGEVRVSFKLWNRRKRNKAILNGKKSETGCSRVSSNCGENQNCKWLFCTWKRTMNDIKLSLFLFNFSTVLRSDLLIRILELWRRNHELRFTIFVDLIASLWAIVRTFSSICWASSLRAWQQLGFGCRTQATDACERLATTGKDHIGD